MAMVKLHVCPLTFLHNDQHACWRVRDALDKQRIPYELVKEPLYPRSRRRRVVELTGQNRLPMVERPDGTGWHARSREMAQTIRDGGVFDDVVAPET
jgi:glutathione S-transferase